MEQLRNMMNTPKCHLMMYMALVFALLLTAPSAVCGGVPNDAYSYTDDFENSLGLDMTASHGVAIIDGQLVSYAADAKAVSKCISLPQPEGSVFEKWSCLKINLVDTLNPGSLAIKRCDDGAFLKTVNLSTADQPIDLSGIPSDETAIRLEWSPNQTDAKADSWEVYGKAYGATAIDMVADTDTSDAGDTVTFTIQMSSSGVVTQNPVLRFSLDDINGLHTPDIDDGLAEDAEADYGSGVNPYRPLEFVEASHGPNGESADVSSVHDVGDFKNVSGEVVWNLKNMTDGFTDNVTVTLKIPEGYINGKTLAAQAVLEHGESCNRMTVEAASGLVTVKSVAGHFQRHYYFYPVLGPGADNIFDYYHVVNTLPQDASNSDIEDVTFTVTGIGSCMPLFGSIDASNSYSYQVIRKLVEGDPITASDPVIIHFDRIDFYSASMDIKIYYDVPEGCDEGNTIGTRSEVVGGNLEWDAHESIHNVVVESCRRGNNHVHRVMSGNDTMDYNKWPGIGEFYIHNKEGSLRAGEFFSTWAPFGGEHYRTHTITLDHSYDLLTIPAGITFHGIRSTWPTTQARFYKDSSGTALVPSDGNFDHSDPTQSGWKPIDSEWTGPFTNPPDAFDNDPQAVVSPGCRLLSVKDIDNPAWVGPDFGEWRPRFLWRVCDGDYGCTELPEGTAMSLNGGYIYTYETKTDPDGKGTSHECGPIDGLRTVYKESKSWPHVYAWPAKDQAPAGDYAQIILTPENSNYASQYVDGRWSVNLYDVKDYIDFQYITGEVLTDGYNIPKPDQNVTGEECNVADDIVFHPPEGECNDPNDSGCMAWWEVPPACQPPNGWGYRDGNNNPDDDYLQMYRFRLNALIKKTTPANTALCFVAEVRTNDLGAKGADNAVEPARWPVSNYVSSACVTVLETPGLDIEKTGPVNRKAGDLFSYNLELKNSGNTPENGWYIADWLPKSGANGSDFTPEYRKIFIDRPTEAIIAEYSQDDMCFADPLGVEWFPIAGGFQATSRPGFQAETYYNINAEARCIRLRKNPDSQWNFNPGDKILSAIDFQIPDDAPEGLLLCNRALAGASVDFGGTSDLYPVETVDVCTEVNDAVYIEVKKRGNRNSEDVRGVKWTITVENRSGTVAKNITVTDDLPDLPDVGYGGVVEGTLPDGWTVVEEPAIGASGGQLFIHIPQLSPDDGNPGSGLDEGSFSVFSTLDNLLDITNCVTVEAEDDWGSKSRECVTVEKGNIIPGKNQIAIDRAVGTEETELFPGDEFSYVITATNDSEASQGVFLQITDNLDDYLAYVGNTFTVNGAAASDSFFSEGVLDFSYPVAVNPGETLTLKFKVKVKSSAPHGYLIENRALIISCTDPDDPEKCYVPQETPVVYARVVNTRCDFNLRVRANRVQVQPTWTHNGTALYELYRRVGTDTHFRRIATVTDDDIQWIMATYLDRDVQNGNTYYYYVANREGCRSEVASITPKSLILVDEIVDPDDDFENPDDDDPVPPGDLENPGDGDDDPVPPGDSGSENLYVGTFWRLFAVTVCGGIKPGVGLYGKDGNIQAYILNEAGKPGVDISPYLDDEKYYTVSGYFYNGAGQCSEGIWEYFHVESVEALTTPNTSYIPLPPEPDPSRLPVPMYRLYSPTFNRHHYCDEHEANYLLANYPEEIWTLEATAFYAYRNAANGTAPVYRLYNEYLQEHLFTIDANEKDTLVNAYENSWKYEGVAFYVDTEPVNGTVPVWRLYSDDLQTHLLTTDVNEKERLLASPGWHDEGVAYYVYGVE